MTMHGRIHQIETHPVTEDEALCVSWHTDDVTPEIADYVDEDPNPTGSISWLKENLANRCGDNIGYGWEWGWFSLRELEELRFPPFWLGVERDMYLPAETKVMDIIKEGDEWVI